MSVQSRLAKQKIKASVPSLTKGAKNNGAKAQQTGSGKSHADLICEIAISSYQLGQTAKGEAFVVKKDGPNLALMLAGGRTGLKDDLARQFYEIHGKTPSASALTDALAVLEGMALQCNSSELFTRIARHHGSVIIDLGDETGKSIRNTTWSMEGSRSITSDIPTNAAHRQLSYS